MSEEIKQVNPREYDVYLVAKDAAALTQDASRSSRDGMKRITMIVTAEFHQRLKLHSVKERITLEDIYREALNDYVAKNDVV